MKVIFGCDSGANAYSCRKEEIDTADYGFEDDEWLALTQDEKYKIVEEWASDRLEIWFEEK